MKLNRSLLTTSLLPAGLLLFAACSGTDDTSSGDGDGDVSGDGDGDASTGGVVGDGDGDLATGGIMGDGDVATGGTGDGDGDGTGGGASTGQVPGTESFNCAPPEGATGTLTLTQVGSGFLRPLLVTYAPNDPRLFVVEQDGLIKINGGGTFLDLSAKTLAVTNIWEERGLLGLAFHPDYATNGLFYVFYSNTSGDSVISEYSVSADANIADAASERILLTIPQTHTNHKGGMLAFGSDGYLYVAVGDGGTANPADGGDPDGQGQNASTLMGSILRIDPSGQPYTAMGNYPGGAPEVWDIGLRNPFRMNFDGCNGDLYIGDVGQELFEEINIEKAGEGGKNYGWNTMEGTSCFNAANKTSPLPTCASDGMTMPVVEYARAAGAAVIGGAVYRGSEIPGLRGTYFYADQVQNTVFSIVYDRDAGTASAPTNLTGTLSPNNIVAIQNGHDGEIYFVSRGDGETASGSILKLESL